MLSLVYSECGVPEIYPASAILSPNWNITNDVHFELPYCRQRCWVWGQDDTLGAQNPTTTPSAAQIVEWIQVTSAQLHQIFRTLPSHSTSMMDGLTAQGGQWQLTCLTRALSDALFPKTARGQGGDHCGNQSCADSFESWSRHGKNSYHGIGYRNKAVYTGNVAGEEVMLTLWCVLYRARTQRERAAVSSLILCTI